MSSLFSKRDPLGGSSTSSALDSFTARRETSGSLGAILGTSSLSDRPRGGTSSPGDSPDPLAVRQKQWDQQLAATEKQEAEVMHQQWKVLREQLSALTNDVTSLRSEFKSVASQVTKNQQDLQAETSARVKVEQTVREVANEQASISRSVQSEGKTRQEADDRLSRDLKQVEELINVTAQNLMQQQSEMKKVLGDEMNRHRLLQDEETRKRIAGDDELQNQLNALQRNLESTLQQHLREIVTQVDGEVKARTQQGVDLMRLFDEMKIALDKEVSMRENSEVDLRTDMGRFREELAGEREQRMSEDAALRKNLQALEALTSQQVQELKVLLEREIASLRAMLESEMRRLMEANKGLSADLLRSLEQEIRERTEECARLFSHLQKVEAKLDNETGERGAAVAELHRLRLLLAEELAAEKRDRADGDNSLSQKCQELTQRLRDLEQKLAAETQDRTQEDGRLRRGLQDLEQAMLQQLRDLKSSLDAETAARIAGDERLDRALQELRAALTAEASKGLGALREELDRALRQLAADMDNLRAALKQEADARALGDDDAKKSWVNPLQQLERTMQQLREALAKEQSTRATGDDDILRTVQQLQNNLGVLDEKISAEARARQQADQAEADTRRKMFDEENRLREKGDDTVRNSIVPELQQLDSELRNLRAALETEVRARAAAEAQLSDAWKQAMGEEARLRVKGDEETARNFGLELQQVQNLLNSLRDAIDGDLRALQARAEEDRQALKEEARLRAQGDQAQGELTTALRQALQAETQARGDEDEKLADAIRNLERSLGDLFGQASASAQAAREGVAALDAQLKDLAGRVQQQLEALERALRLEAEEREQGDRLLQDALALKADKAELDVERMRAEGMEAELRALIQNLEAQLSRLTSLTEELMRNSGWKDEARRIWEAIDTHTHDLNVDTFQEEVKEVRPTIITTQRVVQQQPQRIVQQQAVPTIFVEAHAPTVPTTAVQTAAVPTVGTQKLLQAQPTLMLAGGVSPHVEYVAHAAGQVPFIEDIHLRTLQPAHLREHAMTLYRTLGHHRIGEHVPVYDEELLEWIMNVQRVHVSPLRLGTTGGTAMLRATSPPPIGTPPAAGSFFMKSTPHATTRSISPPPAGFH